MNFQMKPFKISEWEVLGLATVFCQSIVYAESESFLQNIP